MRNNMFDWCVVVPKKPQAVRNRRAWKRRLALFLISIVVLIPA
ncbi:hypothetical protein Xekk_04222 [Xenorhabdus sp. KK7.4]|nr:hypothetical protein Xekk_04222 [Xenorhabdus sp. KK7.4]